MAPALPAAPPTLRSPMASSARSRRTYAASASSTRPAVRSSSYQGVTTVVAGNCGFSIAPTRSEHHDVIVHTLENVEDMDPATLTAGVVWDFETFPEYLDAVRRRGTGLNFTSYIGHSALRLFVMGDAAYERAATAEEVALMAQTVREG